MRRRGAVTFPPRQTESASSEIGSGDPVYRLARMPLGRFASKLLNRCTGLPAKILEALAVLLQHKLHAFDQKVMRALVVVERGLLDELVHLPRQIQCHLVDRWLVRARGWRWRLRKWRFLRDG